MKRTGFVFFVTALTFALGVAAVIVWLKYQRPTIETVQADLPVESKPDKAAEKRKADISELAKNRQLWKEQNIVNYSFVSEQFAGGMYPFVPVQTKVVNSKAISTKPTREKGQLERIDGYDKLNTVEKMFDEIQAAIDREDDLKVTYNQAFGFPEKISTSPANVVGEDMTLRIEITKFEIIKTD
jgi:hypothetical protein